MSNVLTEMLKELRSKMNEQEQETKQNTIQPDHGVEDMGLQDQCLSTLINELSDRSIDAGSGLYSTDSATDPGLDPGGVEPQESMATGKFNYGEALQKGFLFYEANQSGELSNNRLDWRSDSTLNDGLLQGKDLSGGYFDAGDHVKFGQPMAASINMLALGGIEYKEAYQKAGQFEELLNTVKHATDYFLKAHEITEDGKTEKLWVQVGEGGSANDHGYWGSPETVESNTTRNAFYIDASRPGSDIAASTAASFALSSELFRGVDDGYADKLLKNAEILYEFAETHLGKYSDSVPQASPFYTSWSGYVDDLALGAAALGKVTGNQEYIQKAENYIKEQGGVHDWTWAADDQSYGAVVILAQESQDPYFKDQAKGYLDRWVNGEGAIKTTADGFAWRTNWASVPLSASTAFLAELYSDTVEYTPSYNEFATDQVDYILGDNSANFSYMIGFGDNYAQSPHHRGSAGSQPLNDSATPNDHILYGAIVGGPSEPNDFSHNDVRSDWITNEVGVSYNAPVMGALIQQYDNFGGDPLSDQELGALPEISLDY